MPKRAPHEIVNSLAEARQCESWRKRYAWMLITFSHEDFNGVRGLAPQIALKRLYLVTRPDLLGIFNMLPRCVTNWNQACAKRLEILTSYMKHTKHYTQYCVVGDPNEDCKLGLCPETCVPISSMRKKQTAVSHSSAGSEIRQLDSSRPQSQFGTRVTHPSCSLGLVI